MNRRSSAEGVTLLAIGRCMSLTPLPSASTSLAIALTARTLPSAVAAATPPRAIFARARRENVPPLVKDSRSFLYFWR